MHVDIERFLGSGSILALDRQNFLVGWGQRGWSTVPLNPDDPHFYVPDFFLQAPSPWFNHEKWAILSREELDFSDYPAPPKTKWVSPDRGLFADAFTDLQGRFLSGELLKAVPYVFDRSRAQMSKSMLGSLMREILAYSDRYPVHVYGMWNEEEGVLGATPEVLFDFGSKVSTVACAGTYRVGHRREIDEEKTCYEHQLVVDGIKEAFKPFGTIQVGSLTENEYGQLGHFVTPIELVPSKPIDFVQAVRALHPTPALGAFPRDAGQRWLEKYQARVSRGRYGAPFGYLHNRQGRCIVSIRNIQWSAREMRIGAGCGVTAASRLEEEWKEILLKLSAIKEFLCL